jgi:hypothetical protein
MFVNNVTFHITFNVSICCERNLKALTRLFPQPILNVLKIWFKKPFGNVVIIVVVVAVVTAVVVAVVTTAVVVFGVVVVLVQN